METIKDLNRPETVGTRQKKYRFQKISERVAVTNVKVHRQIHAPHFETAELPDEGETSCFLRDELVLQQQKNLSKHFTAFFDAIHSLSETLALLLHNLPAVAAAFKSHLQDATPDTIRSILYCLRACARDCRQHICPHLPGIVDACFSLIEPNLFDIRLCRDVFESVGIVLVQLQKPLVKVDPQLLLLRKWYVELLGHVKQHVRRFTAEALAPLWRKMDQVVLAKQVKLFTRGFVAKSANGRSVEQQRQIVDGVALLFFNIIKSVAHAYHSCCSTVLPLVLEACRPGRSMPADASSGYDEAVKMLNQLMQYAREYTRRGETQVVWDSIVMETKRSLRKGNDKQLKQCSMMLVDWLRHRHHTRVEPSTERLLLHAVVEPLLEKRPAPAETFNLLFALRNSASHHSDEATARAVERSIVENLVASNVDEHIVLQFLNRIFQEVQVDVDVDVSFLRRAVIHICETHVKQKPVESLQLLHRCWQQTKEVYTFQELPETKTVIDGVLKSWQTSDQVVVQESIRLHETFGNTEGLRAIALQSHLPDGLFVHCLAVLCVNAPDTGLHKGLLACALQRLPQQLSNGRFLQAFADILQYQTADVRVPLDASVVSTLVTNVRSSSHPLRLASVRVLGMSCSAPEWVHLDMVQELQRIEEMPVEFQKERERRAAIARLEAGVQTSDLAPKMLELLGNFCLGQLHIKYKPLWNMVRGLIRVVAQSKEGFNAIWPQLETHVITIVQKSCRAEDNTATRTIDLFDSTFMMLVTLSAHVGDRSRKLVPLFFSFLIKEYAGNCREEPELREALKPVEDDIDAANDQYCTDSSRKETGRKLELWLRVLASWSNLRSAWRAEPLRGVIIVLLSKARPSAVPSLCLSALFAFKDAQLVAYKEPLEALTRAQDFRDELLRFKIEDESVADTIYPLVVRILYGRLLVRSAKTKLTNTKKRTIILAFFAGLPPRHLSTLFSLVLQPFKEEMRAGDPVAMTEAVDKSRPELRPSLIQGFIHMVSDIMRQIGTHSEPFLPQIVCAIVGLWIHAEKDTRKGLIEDTIEVFRRFPAYDFAPWSDHLKPCMDVSSLPNACASANEPPTLLRLLKLCAEEETLREWVYAEKWHPELIDSLVKSIQPTTKQGPIELIYDTLYPLLASNNTLLLQHKNVLHLLDNLLNRVKARNQAASRKEMALMTCLADQFKDKPSDEAIAVIDKLIALLVPALDAKQRRRDGHDARQPLLETLNALLKQTPSRRKCLFPLAKMLGPFASSPVSDVSTRAALVDTFGSMGVASAHEILKDMNAWDTTRVAVYDYDKRLGAYERIGSLRGDVLAMVPVVYQVLTDMHDEEYPVRSAAFSALVDIVLPLAEASQEAMDRLLLAVVMPGIKHGIKSHNPQSRRGFIKLLTSVETKVLANDSWRKQPLLFPDLCALLNPADGEASFFLNIVHLQTHRRVRALVRLRKQLPSLSIADNCVVHILLPLALHGVYESTKTTEQEYLKESIALLAALAAQVSWSHYSNLLKQLVEQTVVKPLLRKPLLRAAGAVIESFHFDCSNGSKVLVTMEQHILPQLEQQLVGKKSASSEREVLYMPVVSGVVKLLRLLPEENQSARIGRLLRVVCNALKSYDKDQREEAREALSHVVEALGPQWLGIVLGEMRATLVEGYQLHVLAYSVYTLIRRTEPMFTDALSKARPAMQSTDATTALQEREAISLPFDQALPQIVRVLEKDLFGDAARQKQASSGYKSKINGLVEAKVQCGLKCYELSARLISFLPGSSIHVLLKPLLNRLENSDDVHTLRVVDGCLKRVAAGVVKNPDVSIPHLLVYIHHLLTKPQDSEPVQQPEAASSQSLGVSANWVLQHSANERLRSQEQITKRRAYAGVHIVQAAPQLTGRNRFEAVRKRKRHAQQMNQHVLLEHGLDLLHGAIKRVPKDLTEMLVPFPALLADIFVHTKASRAMVLSLRCFDDLLKLDFKGEAMESAVGVVLERILDVLKDLASVSSVNASVTLSEQQRIESDSKQACVKTLTTLLRRNTGQAVELELEREKLELLVLVIEANIDVESKQLAMFALLKVLVHRQLVCPSMYDLMVKVSKQLFTSSRPQVRAISRQALVHFLLNYPISNNRLEQHISLIMSNLDFAVEDGRLAGLEMVRTILKRFPVEVIDALKDLCYFPLVLRLVNEESATCKSTVADVLASFFLKVEVSSFQQFFTLAATWIAPDQTQEPQLRLAGIQVVALAVQHRSKDVAQLELRNTLDMLLKLLALGDDTDWKVRYHAVVAIHKIAVHSSHASAKQLLMEYDVDGTSCREVMVSRMVDDHVWVRQASSRLMGQFFAELSDAKEAKTLWEDERDWLFTVVERCCQQLNVQTLDAAYSEQILKNLVWLVRGFVTQDDHRCINWLVHRLSYLGRDRENRNRSDAVFKALAFLITQLEPSSIEQYIVPMLSPLYRSKEDEPLAREVMELIESKVSSSVYVRACATVQQQITRIREKRKRERALENVVDPVQNAEKRHKRQQQKRKARQRKIQAKRQRAGR